MILQMYLFGIKHRDSFTLPLPMQSSVLPLMSYYVKPKLSFLIVCFVAVYAYTAYILHTDIFVKLD